MVVRNEVDKTQREYYLREQMRQIQNELGEGDVFSRDAAELKRRIMAANLPDEPRGVALKELVETRGWLKFILMAELLPEHRLAELIDECDQLCRVLGKSVATARRAEERRPHD